MSYQYATTRNFKVLLKLELPVASQPNYTAASLLESISALGHEN